MHRSAHSSVLSGGEKLRFHCPSSLLSLARPHTHTRGRSCHFGKMKSEVLLTWHRRLMFAGYFFQTRITLSSSRLRDESKRVNERTNERELNCISLRDKVKKKTAFLCTCFYVKSFEGLKCRLWNKVLPNRQNIESH